MDGDFGFKNFTPPLYSKVTGNRESKKLRATLKKRIASKICLAGNQRMKPSKENWRREGDSNPTFSHR
jgi:hypothetical protein